MGANESARVVPWNGERPKGCDKSGCTNAPVIMIDVVGLNADGSVADYRGLVQVCELHLDTLQPQARALLIMNGIVEPVTPIEKNLLTVASEHGMLNTARRRDPLPKPDGGRMHG